MSLKLTIEKAVEIAGSQKALAEMIGETQGHISNFKNGTRICGLKKRIQIAEIAGVSRLRTIFEYFEDSLDEKDEFEAEAKRTLRVILDTFPPETDELDAPKRKPLRAISSQGVSWRKRNLSPFKITRLAGFFYAYFRLEWPGFLTRYRARFIADSETSCACASDRMVYSPV